MRKTLWDDETPHGRFMRQLRSRAVDDLVTNSGWLQQLRYNWPEVRRLSKKFAPELTERGVSLERLVIGEEQKEVCSEDAADGGERGERGDGVLEVAGKGEDDADRARDLRGQSGGLGKLGDPGGARRADEYDHPLVKLHRDLLLLKPIPETLPYGLKEI